MKLPHGALFAIVLGVIVVGPMVLAREGGGRRREPPVPTFAEALEKENQTLPDEWPGSRERNAVRQALMTAARGHRAAPCSETAKANYLRAVTAYGRTRLQTIRGDLAKEDLFRTVLDKQLKQAMDQHVEHGFVTMREQGMAELEAAGAALKLVRLAPRSELDAMEVESACSVMRRGGKIEPMKLVHPRDMPKLRARGDEEIYVSNHEMAVDRMLDQPLSEDFCERRTWVVSAIGHYFYMKAWEEKTRVHKQGEAGRAQARANWDTGRDRQVVTQVRALITSGRITPGDYENLDEDGDLGPLFAATPGRAFRCPPKETNR